MEPADRGTALPARVTTFIEQRKTEVMPRDLVEDKGDAVVEPRQKTESEKWGNGDTVREKGIPTSGNGKQLTKQKSKLQISPRKEKES